MLQIFVLFDFPSGCKVFIAYSTGVEYLSCFSGFPVSNLTSALVRCPVSSYFESEFPLLEGLFYITF